MTLAMSRTGSLDYLVALRRVKGWTRQRFALPHDATVMVAEAECSEPGFPPVETVTTFWSKPHIRHVFKVFKPVEEITEEDLPPAFMKDAIVADDNIVCNCC